VAPVELAEEVRGPLEVRGGLDPLDAPPVLPGVLGYFGNPAKEKASL